MATNDRKSPPVKPQGDKLESKVKPEKSSVTDAQGDQVKGGRMPERLPNK